ncbi:Fic family protein [Wolbachia endosymbiont of Ctenocephalides felis wCfeT]|uniref:Fic family protein n=1 Tax=Wolbachia endosymbiont of Ctenocephalides felis wCfeT TaxID=2732593 RepID=UPI001FE7E997|nr:Fic family protein [Wolbachia endosymbiont of Ctenocephalides felis wCfeT]
MDMFKVSTIVITPEMLKLVAEIDEFKGAWQLLGNLAPERLQMLKKVATIESIGSSTRIEGVKLSDREVEQLLYSLDTNSFRSRDEQEVAGYAYVCEEVFQNFENMPFTENIIKQLHIWLLQFSHKDQRHMGEYKKFPNHVEAFNESGKSLGIVFETASPFETPTKMEELIYWIRQQLETKSLHILLVIGIFIVVFLAIHPFQDGNGRLSRILTTFLLLKSGYVYVPYSSLESIVESNKESYYLALRRSQQSLKTDKPDLSPWLTFFLRSLQKQKIYLEQKVANERMLNLHLSPLSSQILSLLSKHGRLTISDLESITKANRNTLKKHVFNLVKSNHIAQYGKGRATWYTLLNS